MTTTSTPALDIPSDSPYWRRNLAVCLVGSFTTIVAMTLLLPVLPLYVEDLGVTGHAAIVEWSGVAYGATFLMAALLAPVWGKMSDLYGRKAMLIRASLGMAIVMSLMGTATNIWQLVGLRLLAGVAGGYSSGSTLLVATETPKARSGWALGALSSGIMAGTLVGPLIGGALPQLIGIRTTFFLSGGVIALSFLATVFLIKESPETIAARAEKRARQAAQKAAKAPKKPNGWSLIPDQRPVVVMLSTGLLLAFATMSIEPIITVYVGELVDHDRVTLISGVVMAAAALGSILSAPRLGKLADRIGHWPVITGALAVSALLLIPQALVTAGWQLVFLRFLMGLALGGLLPCITSVIRHSVPDGVAGNILGYSISAQFAGQVAGPLVGGFIGGHLGMRAVFYGTAVLMAAGSAYTLWVRPRQALD